MTRLISILAFAASVAAVPALQPPAIGNQQNQGSVNPTQMTVGDASKKCTNNQKLKCCNKKRNEGDKSQNGGLLGGVLDDVLDGLSLFGECSDLSVSALIGVDDLLNDKCQTNVACCAGGDTNKPEGVLLNIDLPCVAIGSIL